MFADPLLLARAQFGLNIAFHILFPSITIALAWMLVYLRVRIEFGRSVACDGLRPWVKVFALSFALGVVSGITMSFQFGTNWPGFMSKAGNIAGPSAGLRSADGIFPRGDFPRRHAVRSRPGAGMDAYGLSAFLVAIGTSASAFWILALNSWMQTPQGFEMIDGQMHATSWMAIIFNPSFPYRLVHMMIASGLTAAFLVAGISAFQLLRRPQFEPARRMLRVGVRSRRC